MGGSRRILRPVRSRMAAVWDGVKTSLWFLPGAMAVGGGGLALVLLRVHLPEDSQIMRLVQAPARNAPDFLATLLSSMITMTTLAISITMVVLTLAANMLGFRLIRNFIGDRRTQIGLGMLLGAIVYLLVVLRALPTTGEHEQGLAVTVGTFLVLASIATLLFYVHHLARSIVADTLIHRVGDQLDALVDEFLPKAGEDVQQHPEAIIERERTAVIRGREGGYIQAIDYPVLVRAACDRDCVIELAYRPGHHVLPGGVHGWVSPPEAICEELERDFAEAVVVGAERTPVQDLEFAIRQLVEIGLRALSPSLNDAFTAIAVINRLGLSIATIMARPSAERGFVDGEGRLRVISPVSTFEGLVDIAFHQIRRSAADSPAVMMHLLETLAQLAEISRRPEHRAILAEHIELAHQAGRRAVEEPRDRAAMDARHAEAVASLDGEAEIRHEDGLRNPRRGQ